MSVEREGKTIKTENPAYVSWLAWDQQVLSFLITSLSKETLVQCVDLEHATDVRAAIATMFAGKTKSRASTSRKRLIGGLKSRGEPPF